jgi:hypothetical protein
MSSKNLNPRKLMELAIAVMRDSVPEPRNDSKADPKVGARPGKARRYSGDSLSR